MKKSAIALLSILMLLCSCKTERLPSEDIEVLTKYSDIIAVLKDPKLPPNSKEKYEAAKDLIKVVDLSFTRETKTLNELFYYGDAREDAPGSESRDITFNFQHGDHYVRFRFAAYRNFILRVDVFEK